MLLRDFTKRLMEGGNLAVDGHEAQQIDLKVHNRAYIVPILDILLNSINTGFEQQAGGPLWSPKVLKSRKYLSGSSLHFFNTDIPDDEFERVKPKVGDIDTQINKASEAHLAQYLDSVKGQVVGNAKFLGYSRGNEQYSSLWELTDPPIKVQIDFEFVDYSEKDQPTDWAGFSHSSSWDDLSQGIKGVFHKFVIQALSKISSQDFIYRKVHKRTGKITDKPEHDSMISFAVSSKEGGGLRAKYEPVLDEKGRPLVIDGLPVLKDLPASGYEKDLSKIFQTIFGKRIDKAQLAKVLPKTWSFTGLLEIMNLILTPEEKEQVLDSFVDKMFAPGAQGLYKGDPQRDLKEKNVALNHALKVLGVTPPKNLEQMRQDYLQNYKVTTEGPVGLDNPIDEAEGDQPAVKAQLRKGMPHLRDLKAPDFLDLLDELHDGNGRFKLQNIPLNVKIDGFGGRFGKNAEGKPFMGTSRTEPRYNAGFLAYHQQKGTTDPDVLGRAQTFDDLFNEMMKAVDLVDSKLGPDFLVDKQVTCEVLFLPFATETEEGKLKFVGIAYDKLPKGVQLALVPFRVVQASTGADLPNGQEIVTQLTNLGKQGSVMFIDNSLKQQEGLDVTEIINPLENLEALKSIVSDTSGKRDRASQQLKKEVEEKLMPIKLALEKAIGEDPNILGKDILGQDYEGIVINSRLGPIKVTSPEQKQIIANKNAARAAARAEQPRENSNKTAVVAIGSFVGHKGHEELFNYTINKAKELGGDPYLFIGNAVGKDDPIPPEVKVQTWHKMYPSYAKNIGTVQQGGTLLQKIKHELINPLPGKPPRYDNIVIMVGEDQQNMPIAGALMKAVNKFQGYEHVKASLEATPRGTGMSFTKLRNILKDPNATPEQQYALWAQGFDEQKLGKDWILHLMDITRKGMGITQQPAKQPAPAPVAERLSNALIRPRKQIAELSNEKLGQYKKAASADASAADKAGDYERGNKRFSGIVKATKKQFANDEKGQKEDHSTVSGWGKGSYDTYAGTRHGRGVAEDHEIQMASSELQSIAKDAVNLLTLVRRYSEKDGLDAWQQSKITKAADYLNAVLQSVSGEQGVAEGLPQTLRKVVPGHAKREIDRKMDAGKFGKTDADKDANFQRYKKIQDKIKEQGVAEGLNEFAPDGFNGGDDEGFSPEIAKMAQEDGFTKGAGLADGATLERAMAINHWHSTHGGMYKQYFAKGFKAGRMDKIRHNNKQYNLNLKLMKDGSIRHGEQGVAEVSDKTRNSYVDRATSDYGHANFAARASKSHPGLEKYSQDQEHRAKKRAAGLNRALSDKRTGRDVDEDQRLDKSCWTGYKKQGTKMKGGKRVNNCVPVSEDVELIFANLINKIIVNEAIQNNQRRS